MSVDIYLFTNGVHAATDVILRVSAAVIPAPTSTPTSSSGAVVGTYNVPSSTPVTVDARHGEVFGDTESHGTVHGVRGDRYGHVNGSTRTWGHKPSGHPAFTSGQISGVSVNRGRVNGYRNIERDTATRRRREHELLILV